MTGLKKLRSRRLSLAVTIMAVVWLAGFGLIDRARSQAGGATSQTKPKTAGETFKNVTSSTLKGLTVDDFMGAMGVMAAALGFDCSNCHPGAGYSDVNWQVDTMPTKV